MLEFFLNLEKTAQPIPNSHLIASGLLALLIGLSLWLAGIGFNKPIAAIAGAAAAFTIAYLKNTRNFDRIALFTAAGAVIAIIAQSILTVGPPFWKIIAALFLSALGTASVFTGMILLLLYKGAKPVTYIAARQHFFIAVAVAMILFGTFVQLALCRRQPKSQGSKKQDSAKKKKE